MALTKTTTTILKWLLLCSLGAYAVWASAWARGEASRCVVRDLRVKVEKYSLPDSLIRSSVEGLLRAYPEKIIGAPVPTVNTDKIRRYLASRRNFENVDCMVTTDGVLEVRVQPMVPVMRVFSGGKSFYVNKDGKEIATDAGYFTDVPVVAGRFTRDFRPIHCLPLVKFIAADPTLSNLVNMVYARDSKNLILVPRIAGHVVNFGDTTRLREKADHLMLAYTKVMPYRGWEYYDTISVKYRGQIVATRRDKTRLNHGETYFEETDLEEATLPEAPAPAPAEAPQSAPAHD